MLISFLHGIGIGLCTVIFLGPVFFTLLKNSIQIGRAAGFAVAIGIISSDIAVALICHFAASSYLQSIIEHPILKIAGMIILLFFGLSFIFKSPKIEEASSNGLTRDISSALLQGFLVNFVNPFVFVLWLSFLSIAYKLYPSSFGVFSFVSGILIGILITDVTKVLFAHKIKQNLNPTYLKYFYRIVGVVLILFALRLGIYLL